MNELGQFQCIFQLALGVGLYLLNELYFILAGLREGGRKLESKNMNESAGGVFTSAARRAKLEYLSGVKTLGEAAHPEQSEQAASLQV